VDAEAGVGKRFANRAHDVRNGQEIGAAVGVAEREEMGSCGVGGAERAHGVFLIHLKTVEEMLGVVDNFLPVAAQEGDGISDHP
jgi:hypothetical protein